MALLAGLTGGMGSGKTSAAAYFRAAGADIIDADAVCRALVTPDAPAWLEIVARFGQDILQPDRTIDRARLAQLVFAEPGRRRELEGILHPRVFAEEKARFEAIKRERPGAVVIVDAALLIESGNYKNMDKVIVVACAEEAQVRRLMSSGVWTAEDVERRLKAQMSLREKLRFADYAIYNDGTLAELRARVEQVFGELKNHQRR